MDISILDLEEAVRIYNVTDGSARIYADKENVRVFCTALMQEADGAKLACIFSKEDGFGAQITVMALADKIRSMFGWKINTGIYEYMKGTEHIGDAVQGELKAMHYSCMDIVRSSNAVADYHLYRVLARNDLDNSYTVWIYNDSLKSLCSGRYGLNLPEALKAFWDISWY